jgi:hypothetical protein
MTNRTTIDPPQGGQEPAAATGWSGSRMAPGSTAATPDDARRVWESMAKPSYRRVALALTQAGKPTTAMTVCRWHGNGWTKKREGGAPVPQPLAELDAATPVLTGDALRRIDSLKAELDLDDDGWTDEDMAARGVRELAAASLTALRVARLVDPAVMVEHPDKMGVLFERAGNALLAAIEGLTRLQEIRAAAAKDITPPIHKAPPPPLAATLEAIRRERERREKS